MKIGTASGRATILRGTRIPGHVELGHAAPDGVVRVPDDERTSSDSGPAQLHCGLADLSSLKNPVYVSTSGTDGSTCGSSLAAACKTIARGIRNCTGAACGVLVAWGEYPLTASLQLTQGINVYGGCLSPSSWKPEYFSVILAPPDGQPAVTASGIATATILAEFRDQRQCRPAATVKAARSWSSTTAMACC